MQVQGRSRRRRSGFTMPELLIAVAIIVLLVALSAGAILRLMGTGPYTATTANMNKLKIALETQWKAITDKARKEALPSNYPGNHADPRTRDNYVQEKLRQAFPQSFAEVWTAAPNLGAWSGYVNYLKSLNVDSTNYASVTTPPEQQQAICLLMALEHGPANTGITADSLGMSAVQRFDVVMGTLTKQAFGCTDAWGMPLLFARGSNTIVLTSMGPDKKANTGDEIVSNRDL